MFVVDAQVRVDLGETKELRWQSGANPVHEKRDGIDTVVTGDILCHVPTMVTVDLVFSS